MMLKVFFYHTVQYCQKRQENLGGAYQILQCGSYNTTIVYNADTTVAECNFLFTHGRSIRQERMLEAELGNSQYMKRVTFQQK